MSRSTTHHGDTVTRDITHFHLFCGIGGAARGGRHLEISTSAATGPLTARFRCLGGVDVDPGAVRAFTAYTGVLGTHLDLFSMEQYRAFHGAEPPASWREASAEGTSSVPLPASRPTFW